MTSRVLYFPQIELPESAWTTRMLLYWDEVGAIVPYDFIEDPERLDPYMRSLVHAGLVRQVIPGMYLYEIPNFRQAFLEYLESLGVELERRRKAFAGRLLRRPVSRIHVEKMEDLGKDLPQMRLARPGPMAWFEVERETAADFMAYLAAVLGRLPDLGYAPITDDPIHLTRFVRARGTGSTASVRLAELRVQVLEDLLPAPARPLRAEAIERFKAKHGRDLRTFRWRVEGELIAIADISDADLRQQRLNLFREGVQEELADIESTMKSAGLKDIVFGKLCAIAAAVSGVHWIVGLIAAVYDAFGTSRSDGSRSPFLYSAYARRHLLV